jgi:hypothetical protein
LATPSAPWIILAASRVPADGFVPAARFCRRKLGVTNHMLDRLVAEIGLDGPGISGKAGGAE